MTRPQNRAGFFGAGRTLQVDNDRGYSINGFFLPALRKLFALESRLMDLFAPTIDVRVQTACVAGKSSNRYVSRFPSAPATSKLPRRISLNAFSVQLSGLLQLAGFAGGGGARFPEPVCIDTWLFSFGIR